MQNVKFSFDYFEKGLETPTLYVGDANQNILYTIPSHLVYDLKMQLYFNNICEMSFKIYKFYNDEEGKQKELEAYEYFKGNFATIHTKDYGNWLLHSFDNTNDNGENPYKTLTFKSLESELCTTKIYGYGSMSDDDDFVPLYKIYDVTNQEMSAMHVALKPLKDVWSIGYVSPKLLSSNPHCLEWDESDSYTFLTDTVAKSWDCLILFDTVNRTVNAYTMDDENINKDTNIYISFNNLLKQANLKYNPNEIRTNLQVVGGSNSDGTTFGIADVNLGSNRVSCYDYVYNFWSDSLKSAWDRYTVDFNNKKAIYTDLTARLENEYLRLEKLYNNTTDVIHEMGYYQLCELRDSKLAVISQKNGINSSIVQEQYNDAVAKYNSAVEWIEISELRIESCKEEIDRISKEISDNLLDFEKDYCNAEQRREFQRYSNKIDTYQNDDFCTYDKTTTQESYSLARELYEQALKEIQVQAYPQFEMEVTTLNFLTIDEFSSYRGQFDLGSRIHIDYGVNESISNVNNDHLYARLLSLNLDFNDKRNISITISNKDSLDEKFRLKEIQQQASSSATSISYNYKGIKQSAQSQAEVNDSMKNDRDLMQQRICSNTEEITISNSCLLAKCKDDSGNDMGEQLMLGHGGLAITSNYWNQGFTECAIGRINLPDGTSAYGISAGVVYGDLIIGNRLKISNSANTMTFDTNGLSVTNGVNTFTVTSTDSTCIMSIKKGDEKVLWFDSYGNANFSGNVSASKISGSEIEGTTITGGKITSSSLDGTSSYSLTSGEFVFTNVNLVTMKLIMNYKYIGWSDSEHTLNTIMYPDRVFTPKLQAREIELVNSSKLDIYSNETVFSGDVYVKGNLYIWTSGGYVKV